MIEGFWNNVMLMFLSIFLFIIKLSLNKKDKILLFFIMSLSSFFLMTLFYLIGFDFKVITLGRF